VNRYVASHSDLVGDAWAQRVALDLRREQRTAAGGWPGTMSEARAHTTAHFRGRALTPVELEDAARAVYQRARGRWLAYARTDGEESE
jgi:hypothetical protein